MRVITRKALLAMPAGTIFQTWNDMSAGDLQIFAGPFNNEENTFQIVSARLGDPYNEVSVLDGLLALDSGEEVPAEFDNYGRDGVYYEDGSLFLVWDSVDVKAMIETLMQSLIDIHHTGN